MEKFEEIWTWGLIAHRVDSKQQCCLDKIFKESFSLNIGLSRTKFWGIFDKLSKFLAKQICQNAELWSKWWIADGECSNLRRCEYITFEEYYFLNICQFRFQIGGILDEKLWKLS
jgi:hypothetical protein